MNNLKRKGLMIVVSAPSGCGKTTIVKSILSQMNNIHVSTSVTTRNPRQGEIDGKDYFFVDEKEFLSLKDQDYFLESAKVFDKYYGTPRKYVQDKINEGFDVIFDIDWQGAIQLSHNACADVVSIFILPPSIQELQKRLINRNCNVSDEIDYRINCAQYELTHWYGYDYVFINNDLNESIDFVKSVIIAERNKRSRQSNLPDFIEKLCQNLQNNS